MRTTHHPVPAEIPTSSTADIAFLLIVYFMLTVTFSATAGLDFALPDEPDTPLVEKSGAILIEVLADGGLRLDSLPFEGDLLDALRPRLEHNPRKTVLLRTEPDAPYRAMIEVYDLLRRAPAIWGVDREIQVAIPTEREQETFWQ